MVFWHWMITYQHDPSMTCLGSRPGPVPGNYRKLVKKREINLKHYHRYRVCFVTNGLVPSKSRMLIRDLKPIKWGYLRTSKKKQKLVKKHGRARTAHGQCTDNARTTHGQRTGMTETSATHLFNVQFYSVGMRTCTVNFQRDSVLIHKTPKSRTQLSFHKK